MLIAVISTLGSIIVAYITAIASKKSDKKEDVSELEKLKHENSKLKSELAKKERSKK